MNDKYDKDEMMKDDMKQMDKDDNDDEDDENDYYMKGNDISRDKVNELD